MIFANKCLNIFIEFKKYVNSVFNTFKNNFSSIDSQKYKQLDEELNDIVLELNNKRRRIGFNENENMNVIKEEIDLCNDYNDDNELNDSEDSIGSDDKQTLERQQKRQKTTKRLISKSPDCGFSANSVEELQEHWNMKYNCHYSDCRYITETLCDINRHIAVHVKRNQNSDTISAVIEDIIARNDSHSDSGEDRAERKVNVTDKSGPLECQYCGKIAKRHNGLVTHINSCHPEHAIQSEKKMSSLSLQFG